MLLRASKGKAREVIDSCRSFKMGNQMDLQNQYVDLYISPIVQLNLCNHVMYFEVALLTNKTQYINPKIYPYF